MNPAVELSNKLFRQALHETGVWASTFAFDIRPNSMQAIIERYQQLCRENNLNPITGEFEEVK